MISGVACLLSSPMLLSGAPPMAPSCQVFWARMSGSANCSPSGIPTQSRRSGPASCTWPWNVRFWAHCPAIRCRCSRLPASSCGRGKSTGGTYVCGHFSWGMWVRGANQRVWYGRLSWPVIGVTARQDGPVCLEGVRRAGTLFERSVTLPQQSAVVSRTQLRVCEWV